MPVTALSRKKAGVRAYIRRIAEEQRERHEKYLLYHIYLAPKSLYQYLRRLQFAVCSAYQGWQGNVKMMEAIRKMPKDFTVDQLTDAFKEAGTGLYDRAKSLHKLTKDFLSNPFSYMPQYRENEYEFRDRLASKGVGMGTAKASFAIELIYPDTCRVVCLDRWILADYGIKASKAEGQYRPAEQHWTKTTDDFFLTSAMPRHMRWDDYHGKTSTRYWSYVLEDEQTRAIGRRLWPESDQDIACQSPCDSCEQEEWLKIPPFSSEVQDAAEARRDEQAKKVAKYDDNTLRRNWSHKSETCIPT